MTAKEIRSIIKICSRMNVSRIKMKEFEIEFGDKTIKNSSKLIQKKIDSNGIEAKRAILPMLPKEEEKPQERPPTEDEMLLWSSPAYNLVRDQREKAMEAEPR